MSAEKFRAQRRQKFLPEKYFSLNIIDIKRRIENFGIGTNNRRARGNLDPVGQRGIFIELLNIVKINYTAGCPIEEIKQLFDEALAAFGDWSDAYRRYVKFLADESGDALREDGTPLYFEDLFNFQLAMEITSLAVLFGDGDALRQIAMRLERNRGTDLLFEYLIAPGVSDPRENTDFFHAEPYDPLVDAFYTAHTREESAVFVKKYLDGWYKSFEGVPWHDGHLMATDDYMPYYGYWSFEAAAVCVIHGIDDSSFRDHLIYPKDLADWARANWSVARLKAGSASEGTQAVEQLRCEAGQRCPRVGWWFTPARTDSRRLFNVGEVMPRLDGDYGATIWQWAAQQ